MRAEASHVVKNGYIAETRIRWLQSPVGREREELEKKLEDMGITVTTAIPEEPCPPGGR